mgnify:CR=1 FL=1
MKKQFKGIKWIKNNPYFLLYDFNNKNMEIRKAIGKVSITKTNIKKCNGYYDLLNRKYVPCKNFDNEFKKECHQCKLCKELSGFGDCLGCNGKNCKSKSLIAKKFCNQKHIVYIALFGNDKLKVGTAAEYRKYSRILDQGAIASMFIAITDTGKTARFLENYISSFGYSLQVRSNYKINNLVIDKSKKEIVNLLENEYDKIKNMLPDSLKKYLTNPEINYYEKINDINKNTLIKESAQLSLFDDGIKVNNYDFHLYPETICGIITNVVGSMLIIENHGVHVYDTKKLEGWIIDIE